MKLFNFFKESVQTVASVLEPEINQNELIQQIHDEFDSACDRETQMVDKLLSELEIPTQTQLEEKAKRLAAIGFTNSNVVKQAQGLEIKRKEVETQSIMLSETAQLLRSYQQKYPFQKILTEDELKRICKKYNLIYAPVSHYKMDVPEKNLQEIEIAQKLDFEDKADNIIELIGITDLSLMNYLGKKDTKFTQKEINALCIKYYGCNIPEWTFNVQNSTWLYAIKGEIEKTTQQKFSWESGIYKSVKITSRGGLQICAPQKEFDLTGLKMNEFGYANVSTFNIEDPIVFEFMKGGIIRVISKWGLESSDEMLVNPINN